MAYQFSRLGRSEARTSGIEEDVTIILENEAVRSSDE